MSGSSRVVRIALAGAFQKPDVEEHIIHAPYDTNP